MLEDLKLAKTQNLTQNPIYSFSAVKNDSETRFLLHFGGAFGVNENGITRQFSIYSSGSMVYISNNSGAILKGDVIIYNMIGQLVMRQPLDETALTKISFSSGTGYYLVKVIAGNQVCSAKLFIDKFNNH
jgi:hypothetical protein